MKCSVSPIAVLVSWVHLSRPCIEDSSPVMFDLSLPTSLAAHISFLAFGDLTLAIIIYTSMKFSDIYFHFPFPFLP